MAALASKEAGNAAFGKKEYSTAAAAYASGLKELSASGSYSDLEGGDRELAATLLSNRAASLLGMEKYNEACEDCSASLELDNKRVKSLYRRAQAYEALDKLSEAFKDLKLAIHIDPKNKPAIVAARRVKDALAAQIQDQSPVAQTVRELTADDTLADRRIALLKSLIGTTVDDVGSSLEVLRRQGLPVLWEITKATNSETEAHLAIRCMASMASHVPVADALIAELSLAEIVGLVEGYPALAVGAVGLLLRLLTKCSKSQAVAAGGGEADGTLSTGELEAAEVGRCDVAIDAWAAAMASSEAEVRDAALDAVVNWCSEEAPKWATAVPEEDARRLPMSERKAVQEAEARWKAVIGVRASRVCQSVEVAMAMFNLLDSESSSERQKALAAFGRVAAAIPDPEMVQTLLEPILSASPGTGGDLSFMRRKAALASAMFLAHQEVGVFVLGRSTAVQELVMLISSGDDIGTAAAAETLCLAASNEQGRALLAPVIESGTLDALLDSPNARARSAAASAIAKLGVASKALDTNSSDTDRLLNTAMLLLKGAEDVEQQEGKKLDAAAAAEDQANSARVTTERAVEVIAALITKSAVKDEIAHGSGRCTQALPRLCAACKDGRSAVAYGLAHIFASLTVTNKDVQRRQLAEKEMDITPEQLEELQRITKQKNDDDEEEDTPQRVAFRTQKIVQNDGIRALVRLADGASESTQLQVAMALRQIAVEVPVRGSMVQHGAFRVCSDLASSPKASVKCVREAAWCLGKILVTTNPNVLTEAQRLDAIPPLMRLLKDHHADELMHFEALLGLTNLASVDDATKNRITSEKGGVRALEYLQFSDHELVRRAATECMTNLLPHPKVVEHLRDPEKIKLWVGFSEDYEADFPTARAAAGALAMAVGLDDEELTETLVNKSACIRAFVGLLSCGHPELVHRAGVGITYLADIPHAVTKLKKEGAVPALKKLVKAAKKDPTKWAAVQGVVAGALEAVEAAKEADPSEVIVEVDDAGDFDISEGK